MPDHLQQAGAADVHAWHLAQPQRFPFLLESRLQGEKTGRYSLLLGDVEQHMACREASHLAAFLQDLQWRKTASSAAQSDLPFCGGWFVYLSYEAAQGLLPHVQHLSQDAEPLARAAYCRSAIVVDHLQDCSWFVGDARDCASQSLDTSPAAAAQPPWRAPHFVPEPADNYRRQVEQAIEYILAGDIYQANLARRWQAEACSRDDLLTAYTQLRQHNPACFAASALWSDFALASASPERLFRIENGRVDTRPIAGTRASSSDPALDQALRRELISHPKEQAEHIMLVDLERHDMGRISTPGSVQVQELLTLESYASVHHLVSNICGELRPGITLHNIFGALFPGGTITGCPKIRCMQIIAELEKRPRGAYTGSLGYISDCGRMDFNILIRTLVWQNGRMHLDAGAGIVADSQSQQELLETDAKAQGVLQALNSSAGAAV